MYSKENLPKLGEKVIVIGSEKYDGDIGYVFAIMHRFEMGPLVIIDKGVTNPLQMAHKGDEDTIQVSPEFVCAYPKVF